MGDEAIDKALQRLLTEGVTMRDGKHQNRYIMVATSEDEEDGEDDGECDTTSRCLFSSVFSFFRRHP
jgi:hypothetical protein